MAAPQHLLSAPDWMARRERHPVRWVAGLDLARVVVPFWLVWLELTLQVSGTHVFDAHNQNAVALHRRQRGRAIGRPDVKAALEVAVSNKRIARRYGGLAERLAATSGS